MEFFSSFHFFLKVVLMVLSSHAIDSLLLLEILLFLCYENENCQGMIGCGWMRFAINKELSGHVELWFWIQNYFSFTWQKRIKRKIQAALDSGAASSFLSWLKERFMSQPQESTILVWSALASFLMQALLLACGFMALCSEAVRVFWRLLMNSPFYSPLACWDE